MPPSSNVSAHTHDVLEGWAISVDQAGDPVGENSTYPTSSQRIERYMVIDETRDDFCASIPYNGNLEL